MKKYLIFLFIITNINGQSIIDNEEKYAIRESERNEPFSKKPSNEEITIDLRDVTRRGSSPHTDPLSPIKIKDMYDKKGFIKEHIDGLKEKTQCYGICYKTCLCLNVSWMTLSGLASAATVIISAIGAADFVNPKISNVTSTALATFGGFCVWAATQSKKTSHQYYKANQKIKSSLGIPQELLEPEVIININTLDVSAQHTEGSQSIVSENK